MKVVFFCIIIFIFIGIKVVVIEEGVILIGSDVDIFIELFILVEENGKEIVEIV